MGLLSSLRSGIKKAPADRLPERELTLDDVVLQPLTGVEMTKKQAKRQRRKRWRGKRKKP